MVFKLPFFFFFQFNIIFITINVIFPDGKRNTGWEAHFFFFSKIYQSRLVDFNFTV